MTTPIQSIILLACAFMCISQVKQVDSTDGVIIMGCQCVKMSKAVKVTRIADVKIYEPRPHCNKKEVIVVLRGDEGLTETCLDPNTKFAQAVVKTYRIQMAKRAAEENNSSKQKRATM